MSVVEPRRRVLPPPAGADRSKRLLDVIGCGPDDAVGRVGDALDPDVVAAAEGETALENKACAIRRVCRAKGRVAADRLVAPRAGAKGSW
jgi:hypothetical protein